jgi:transposase-like protein
MIDYGALAGRAHGGRPTVAIVLSAAERARIEAMMRPAKAEQRIVRRAQALLMMADGVPGTDIARLLGVDVATVQKWRRRFDCENPGDKLADAPRSGRPPSLSRTRSQRE